MPERDKKFHEFAIKSILFKGHTSLYLSYLKSEKIAHVLATLQARSAGESVHQLGSLVGAASRLPETLLHFAAGEVDLTVILADIFALLSATRLAASQQLVGMQNASVLCSEYERLAEALSAGTQLSPFISANDFILPSLPQIEQGLSLVSPLPIGQDDDFAVKDTKGQSKGQKDTNGQPQGQSKRMSLILEFVRKHKNVSIKDISKVIKDCSEKTIQRELALLIQHGLVVKRGERRWSVYSPK